MRWSKVKVNEASREERGTCTKPSPVPPLQICIVFYRFSTQRGCAYDRLYSSTTQITKAPAKG